MRKLITSIITIGLTENLPFAQQNKIRIFNSASSFLACICIFYMLFGIIQQRYLTIVFTSSEFCLILVGFLLMRKQKFNFAFHFGLISGLFFIVIYSFLFGERSQTHIYLLFMPIAGIILFDKPRIISTYFVLCALFLACSQVIFHLFEPVYPYNKIIDTIGWLNFVFTVTLIFLGVKQFKMENVAFNREINLQRLELKEKNKDITDSIHYAKRIQKALMASSHLLDKNLSSYFTLYLPKDIVSGDFYWAHKINSKFLVAVCDCTGHGVPGAFMSLLNITKLNQTVLEKNSIRPDVILNLVREDIIKVLNPEGTTEEGKDGMDAALCSFDFENLKLEYACANNPIWVIRKLAVGENEKVTELIELKADKMPVGMYSGAKLDFTLNTFDLQKDDCIYMFTDGYADQFGGPKGKKFKYAQLKEVLLSIYHLPMEQQQAILQQTIEAWKNNMEQVDDILIMGIKV
jgi:serine phosphatase RsbU (regulator of sigma subunit)